MKSLVRAPVAVADAVEQFARERGTHARIGWNVPLRCFVIDFDLREDDPRMRAWRDGELRRKPVESVPLHEWDAERKQYVALPLEELGPTGLIARLEKADMLSGRGEYNTLYEALAAVNRKNQEHREDLLDQIGELGRETAWLHGPSFFHRPQVAVPDTIEPGAT